jgi:predicted TIM-barrel fold metal-dependent hydrolase
LAGLKGGWTRRSFVTAGAVAAAGAIGAWRFWPEQGILNPCLGALPPHLASHDLVRQAWEGLDPAQLWDAHAHLVGTGDTPSGIRINPKMGSVLHPREFGQRVFFLNAGCAEAGGKSVDESYIQRMRDLLGVFPSGAKTLLYAFERTFDAKGEVDWEQTDFYVPDAYARSIAQLHPDRFEWVASIHPYRPDAIKALEEAKRGGARAVKWLPSAMGIDPASERCKPFYDALLRLDLPLISHAGLERAVAGVDDQDLGNPLKLRSALRAGVRVVVAHCASMGEDRDLDAGKAGASVLSFDLFARIMGEREFEGRLFGDLSAITQTRRAKIALGRILRTPQWHPRLLNGSDYPLPGLMPIFSVDYLVSAGMIDAAAAPVLTEIRRHNVLLFDFVAKRLLRADGRRLPAEVFETRGFFDRPKEARAAGGRS